METKVIITEPLLNTTTRLTTTDALESTSPNAVKMAVPLELLDDALVPLNLDLIKHHKKDWLLVWLVCRYSTRTVCWKESRYWLENYKEYIETNLPKLAVELKTTKETMRRYLDLLPDSYDYAGSFALLPRNTYDQIMEATKDMTYAERCGTIRVFAYMVCMCWAHPEFTQTVERIAVDLDNRLVDVRRRLNWLVEHDFINIARNHYNFAGKTAHPRVYRLYREEVPHPYCDSEWWLFGLADHSISLDEILNAFGNDNGVKKLSDSK